MRRLVAVLGCTCLCVYTLSIWLATPAYSLATCHVVAALFSASVPDCIVERGVHASLAKDSKPREVQSVHVLASSSFFSLGTLELRMFIRTYTGIVPAARRHGTILYAPENGCEHVLHMEFSSLLVHIS